MTRPTLGREASLPTPVRPHPFSRALASALDRAANPPGTPGDDVVPDPARASLATLVARSAVARSRSTGGPGLVALAPTDTPDAARDQLTETVDAQAAPLWREFLRRRDPEARRRLVEHHATLVRRVAEKLAVHLPSSVELSDLLQSGTFGLMDAVDRFDPARRVRFEGYAAQRVRGAILDELRGQDWVPRTVRARVREVERARDAVAARLGRPASDGELAAELGIGLRELRQVARPMYVVSADDLAGPASPGAGVLGALIADDDADPAAVAARRETGAELRAAIAELGDRDRTVLRLYYLENNTLGEIGVRLGVTESRVCQLHARMIARLRVRMEPALAG